MSKSQMTPKEFQEIRRRCEEASLGPWFEVKTTRAGKVAEFSKFPFSVPDDMCCNDKEFASHARTDVPALLDELERAADQVNENYTGYRRLIDLLRRSRMKHGTCNPRSRKACTACNAIDELNAILAADKGDIVSLVW